MQKKQLNALFGFVPVSSQMSLRRGTVMLFCIIVNALLSLMAIGMLNALSMQASKAASIETNDNADYLALAGIQRAMERLEQNPGWSGTLAWDDKGMSLAGRESRMYTVNVRVDQTDSITITSKGQFGQIHSTKQIVYRAGTPTP